VWVPVHALFLHLAAAMSCAASSIEKRKITPSLQKPVANAMPGPLREIATKAEFDETLAGAGDQVSVKWAVERLRGRAPPQFGCRYLGVPLTKFRVCPFLTKTRVPRNPGAAGSWYVWTSPRPGAGRAKRSRPRLPRWPVCMSVSFSRWT
jgi:hypothetical protein